MVRVATANEGRIGRYRLVKRLAVGGMADIFLAQRHGTQGYERTVVVKTIRADLLDDEDLIPMLVEEARIARCLRHPNIVELVELGEEGDTHYLVMEFVFGRDLGQLRDRCEELGITIPPEHLVTIAADLLDALHYAHHQAEFEGKPLRVVHRDVSPQNILVGFDGQVKLLDFGLAKAAAQMSKTRAGVLKGKYAYMSPEQAGFEPIDHRSDLFSVGVVLWELLTGKRLFYRTGEYETVRAVTRCRVPFPTAVRPDVPLGLAWIAFRALRKTRFLRYRTAAKMRAALLAQDNRDRVEARKALAAWVATLFERPLAARELALQRAKNDPSRRQQIHDAGFELLEETTDPDLRLKPVARAPTPSRPNQDWAVALLSSWRWFFAVLGGLLLFGIAFGLYLGSPGRGSNVAWMTIDANVQPVSITVNTTNLGAAPLRQVPVLPGRHRVIGVFAGEQKVVEVEVAPGEQKRVRLDFRR